MIRNIKEYCVVPKLTDDHHLTSMVSDHTVNDNNTNKINHGTDKSILESSLAGSTQPGTPRAAHTVCEIYAVVL